MTLSFDNFFIDFEYFSLINGTPQMLSKKTREIDIFNEMNWYSCMSLYKRRSLTNSHTFSKMS